MDFIAKIFKKNKRSPSRKSLERSPSSPPCMAGRESNTSSTADYDDICSPEDAHEREIRRSNTFSEFGSQQRRTPLSIRNHDSKDPLQLSYCQIQMVHKGRHATIFHAHSKSTLTPVVVKAYNKAIVSSLRQEQKEHELKFLQAATTLPGVVQLREHFEDDCWHYLVLELCPGMTLIEYMAECGGHVQDEQAVIKVVLSLLQTMSSLHEMGIVHRDVKPEHCVFDGKDLRLLDFSEAADIHSQCLNSRSGTLQYMAPEMLTKPRAEDVFHQVLYHGISEEELPQYNEKVDVWSVGVLAFELLTGMQPFLADNCISMLDIQQQECECMEGASTPKMLQRQRLSPQARDCLSHMLKLEPSERWSAAQLLKHAWLQPVSQQETGQPAAPMTPPQELHTEH